MAKRTRSSIPHYRRRRPRSVVRRILGWIVKIVVAFFLISILWVLAYRFINPPLTFTMIGDLVAGRGAHKEWMPIGKIDRDMVRASIAAEDSKFCTHHGFDFESIEDAMKRNASGGRIRGGSTISQQTAKNAFLWQGGGYARKGVEAWFTFLIEHLWGKRRIMEVYLNLAETGIGTYGVSAGSQRYFGHDVERDERNRGSADRGCASAAEETRCGCAQGIHSPLWQYDRRAHRSGGTRWPRRLRLQGDYCATEQGAAAGSPEAAAAAW